VTLEDRNIFSIFIIHNDTDFLLVDAKESQHVAGRNTNDFAYEAIGFLEYFGVDCARHFRTNTEMELLGTAVDGGVKFRDVQFVAKKIK